MNRLAGLLVLALLLPFTAHADDASHKAKAEELAQVLHMEHSLQAVAQGLAQQTHTYVMQRYQGNPPPEVNTSLADLQKKFEAAINPQLGWDVIKPEFVRIVAEKFTEEQLDQILAFYKSPGGKALLENMPQVSQEAGELVQTRFTALQPQLKQIFDDFTKTLPPPTASGAPLAPRPAAPATPPPAPSTTK